MSNQDIGNRIQEIVKTEYSSMEKAIEAESELLTILPKQENPYRVSDKITFSTLKRTILVSLFCNILIWVIFISVATLYNYVISLTQGIAVFFLLTLFSILFFILSFITVPIITYKISKEGKKINNHSRVLLSVFTSSPWILVGLFSIIGQFTDPVGFGLITENLSYDYINSGDSNTMTKNEVYRMMLFFLTLFNFFLIFTAWKSTEEMVKTPYFDEDQQQYYDISVTKRLPIEIAPKLRDIFVNIYNYRKWNQIEVNHQYNYSENLKEIIDSLTNPKETKDENFFYIIFYKFSESESYKKGYIDIIVNFRLKYYIETNNNQSNNNETQLKNTSYSIKWCCFSKEFTKEDLEEIYGHFKPIIKSDTLNGDNLLSVVKYQQNLKGLNRLYINILASIVVLFTIFKFRSQQNLKDIKRSMKIGQYMAIPIIVIIALIVI